MTAPDWPQHPTIAADLGDRWYVKGFPPVPYPFQQAPPFDHAKFGPAGTRWIFTGNDILDAITHVPGTSTFLRVAMQDLYDKLCQEKPSNQLFIWQVPADDGQPNDPLEYGMRWIHATINAKLGDNETLTHTLNFRTAPAADADQDAAAIQTFANQLRDAWATFMNTVPANGSAPKTLMGNHVVYQDVTAAYLEQTQPAEIGTVTVKGRPRKTFTYPRPNYLVPTQYAMFAPGVAGTGTDSKLPFEVACCVSFSTGLRGPRNRGRLYLGGLTSLIMGADGNFTGAACNSLATSMSTFVHAVNLNTGNRLHVVSRAYATSVGVNGVQVGVVPDSQRRRRRNRLEAFAAPIAT